MLKSSRPMLADQKAVAEKIQQLQTELESGKIVDATTKASRDITPQERLQHHKDVLTLIQAAERPVQSHYNLAGVLITHGGDFAVSDPKVASQSYQAAAKEIATYMGQMSALPIDLIKKEGDLLNKDVNNPDVSKLARRSQWSARGVDGGLASPL